MKYLLTGIACLGFFVEGHAQNIYGKATEGTKHYLRQFSTHTLADTMVVPDFIYGGGSTCQTTTDLDTRYFFMPGSLHLPPGTAPWVVEIVDVKTKARITDTVADGSLCFPEYHDDTLWGLSIHGISFYDVNTGTEYPYHNFMTGSDITPFYKGVQKSAFDHNTMTYMFSKRGAITDPVDTFYLYHVRTKQITRHTVPKDFIYFDYSPLDDRCYFMNGYNLDSAKGIYQYNFYTNVFTLHHDWGTHHGVLEATFDPVKNRLYFISVRQQTPPKDIIGCYRINSRKNDFYQTSISYGWVFLEYLNTYHDTTIDPFPAGVDEIAGGREAPLLVYPNPARDVLVAKTTLKGDVEAVTWDMQGRIIKREHVIIMSGTVNIDVSTLPGGRYVLGLTSREGEQSAAFTVER